MAYSVTRVRGLDYKGRHRGIAFLECSEDESIDAKVKFEGLKEKKRNEMLSRFDYWLGGGQSKKYFHGFVQPGRRECFVFKRKDAGTYHRFYCFLINPRPSIDPRYQVCILVSHAQKNTEHTNPSELDAVNTLRVNKEVIKAVQEEFS